MKVLKELEVKFSLSVHRVVEVQKDNVDIVRGSPSLVKSSCRLVESKNIPAV